MKRKLTVWLLFFCFVLASLCCLGVGPYTSSSAVSDLKAELETIYGTEYTGKTTDTGTEDMTFVVEPKTILLTNWNFRNTFGLDYRYECRVIFTTHTPDGARSIRTVTYQAADPMGTEKLTERAYLDLSTMKEASHVKE